MWIFPGCTNHVKSGVLCETAALCTVAHCALPEPRRRACSRPGEATRRQLGGGDPQPAWSHTADPATLRPRGGAKEAVQKQTGRLNLFPAGQSCAALRAGFTKSCFLTAGRRSPWRGKARLGPLAAPCCRAGRPERALTSAFGRALAGAVDGFMSPICLCCFSIPCSTLFL